MKLTIFAATGGIGSQILEQARSAGHQVTAVVRNPNKLNGLQNGVRVVTADLAAVDQNTIESAVAGADAVLSGLGASSNAEAGIAAQGTRAIVDAMGATGVRRIIVVSAAPVSTVASPDRPRPPKHDPGEGFVMRNFLTPFIKIVLRKVYADHALMEDLLRGSNLDWTIFRPPQLNDKPLTAKYRTALGQNLRRGFSISRADVAHAMLASLNQPQTIRRTVGIAY
ncbi:MAG TPA: SDR family oxidoreductase [Pyrinomonadaceae bacterium]|jgi:putative NADH-flavin reductase|nr:SDR family oxidoreductase [Pyrinomonadaceae bacterium]